MAISLDGASPEAHDGFRGVEGTFALALKALDWAREVGLMTQVSHQVNGQGLPGAFPPLTHLDKVVQAKGGGSTRSG
jgi:sulfatase maturation enzyme AslB (radical SAM superfamily)